MNSPLFKNLQTTMDALGYDDTLSWAAQTTSGPDTNLAHYPRLMYYYHPDYLGHVEYITDLDGVRYQYFYYTAPMSRLPTSKPLVQRCFSADWSRPLARLGETLIEEKATRPGMHFDSPYRFNAKELDEEPTSGSSRTPLKINNACEQTGLYYYGARYYNPMVSVWLGVDPLAEKYPSLSSYVFTGNNPIMLVDPDGRFIVDPSFKKYKNLTSFLNTNGLLNFINKNPKISEGLRDFGQSYSDGTPYFTPSRIEKTFKAGSVPTVSAKDFSSYELQPNAQTWQENFIEFNQEFLSRIEGVLADPNASEVDKQGALLRFIVTATHEPIHSSEWGTGGKSTHHEMGNWFETFVYGNVDSRSNSLNFDYESYNMFESWKTGNTSNKDFINYLKETGRESLIPDVSKFMEE
jgi:RHS repeat-associated protein